MLSIGKATAFTEDSDGVGGRKRGVRPADAAVRSLTRPASDFELYLEAYGILMREMNSLADT